MTSEAEGRDETTTAGVTPDVTANMMPDAMPDVTADVAAGVTPDVTAEETGTATVVAARADGDAETADVSAETAAAGAETADRGAAMVDGGAATATTSAPAAPATAQPATPALEAVASPVEPSHLSPMPVWPQQEGARIRHSLETIKTAVVWLIVIQILTILSPLLRVPLKWMLLVGLVLTLGSFAVGAVAYLKAQRAQSGLPE